MGSSLTALRNPVLHLQLLVCVAFLAGGGGVSAAMPNLLVQLAALCVLALNLPSVSSFLRRAPRVLVALVALTIALPLVQLIPLPPSLWHGLPGRDLVIATFDLAGISRDTWFPASVDRGRTLVALIGTIPPATMIVVGYGLNRQALMRLAATMALLALVALLWGVVQLSSGNSFGMLFGAPRYADVLYGPFANRNSTGLLFVCAICLLPLIAAPQKISATTSAVIRTAAGALLATGVILTQSRSSIALLALVLLLIGAAAAWRFMIRRNPSAARAPATVPPAAARWLSAALIAAILAVGALSFANGGRVAESLSRFEMMDTDRPEMWEDGIFVAGHYWPIGAGMGTFDEVFQVDESLEYVSPRRAGRAHNDYIELSIEAGIAGLLLLGCWLAWCAGEATRGGDWVDRRVRLSAGLAVACIALQSALDYPLRNQTMLVVAALLVVLISFGQTRSRA